MTKEIDFTDPTCRDTLGSALNFYSQNFDYSHSKKWALVWLLKHAPEEHDRLKNEPDRAFSNRGYVCRMIHRGFKGSDDLHDRLMRFFKAITPRSTDTAPTPKKKLPAKVTINEAIMQVEDAIDDIMSDRDPRSITLPIDAKQLVTCREWIEKEVLEASEQIEKFKAILACLETTYSRAGGVVENLIKSKPKVQQQPVKKVASQAVKTTTYQKEDKELGIVSISPAKVVGAKKAFVYQTKYKIGMVFIAKEGETLTINGSSVRNFDPAQSYMKTIRKPKDFFTAKNIYVELGAQTSKRQAVTSHIADSMIIVNAE